MAYRTKKSDLEALVAQINKVMGAPSEPWTRHGVEFRANVGNYHLDLVNGRVGLSVMVGETGSVRTIFGGCTKAELAALMRAYLAGAYAIIDKQ
jgi:hypothetical protein